MSKPTIGDGMVIGKTYKVWFKTPVIDRREGIFVGLFLGRNVIHPDQLDFRINPVMSVLSIERAQVLRYEYSTEQCGMK